jgi:hypothetical protein
MANQPIGVTFMPSEDNQAMGPRNYAANGPAGGDLADAFKILSLRLPTVLGASALSSKRLLTSPGAAGVGGGFNPSAAVFDALLRAMTGNPAMASPQADGGGFGASGTPSQGPTSGVPPTDLASLFGMPPNGGNASAGPAGAPASASPGLAPPMTWDVSGGSSTRSPAPRVTPGDEDVRARPIPWDPTAPSTSGMSWMGPQEQDRPMARGGRSGGFY